MTPPAHPATVARWVILEILGGHFGGLGAHLGIIFAVLGTPWDPFWRSRGTPGRVWRAVVAKDRFPQLAPHHFKRFRSPKGFQPAPKMDLKSIKNTFKNRSNFGWILIGFGMVFGQFLEGFWDPGPYKMSCWCRRSAIFQKFTFFWSDSFLERFWRDVGWFWGPFWEPKRCQNGFKNRSTN